MTITPPVPPNQTSCQDQSGPIAAITCHRLAWLLATIGLLPLLPLLDPFRQRGVFYPNPSGKLNAAAPEKSPLYGLSAADLEAEPMLGKKTSLDSHLSATSTLTCWVATTSRLMMKFSGARSRPLRLRLNADEELQMA
jgi:hypothetical protein